jgi:phosphatidate cytidylyltransferase
MAAATGRKHHSPAGIKPASFLLRFATAVGYAVAVLAALWLGPLATGVVFGIMAGVAAGEFYGLTRREARLPNEFLGVAAAASMPLAATAWGMSGLTSTLTALIAGSLVWHTVFRRTRLADTAVTLLGTVYTGFLLSYIVLIIKNFSEGRALAVLLVLSVWANDSFAYFFGSLLGRHKMAPQISPAKSWEGFIGGSLGTIAVWMAAPWVPGIELAPATAFAVGLGVAIAAVVGDLAESRMKREAGVKDSGMSLPGHGGFLDRLDSLILVCLVAYWLLWWSGLR